MRHLIVTGKIENSTYIVTGMSFDKQEEIKYTLKEINIDICCLTEAHGNMNDDWDKYEVHSARKESEGKAGGWPS